MKKRRKRSAKSRRAPPGAHPVPQRNTIQTSAPVLERSESGKILKLLWQGKWTSNFLWIKVVTLLIFVIAACVHDEVIVSSKTSIEVSYTNGIRFDRQSVKYFKDERNRP